MQVLFSHRKGVQSWKLQLFCKSHKLYMNFCLYSSLPLTHSAHSDSAPLSGGFGDRWRAGSRKWNHCQEPAEFTLDLHNLLVSTSRCTAEACVSTLESRVWSTKTTWSEDFGSKSEINSSKLKTNTENVTGNIHKNTTTAKVQLLM